jgi:hypothetical protein
VVFLGFFADLVMFLPFSDPSYTMILYNAAVKLHKAMWEQDLESRLQEVSQCGGLKYLPATAIEELQLRRLGCTAEAILVREEYPFTLKALEARQNNSGGIIVTGHPGIGMNSLQNDNFAHVLLTSRQVGIYLLRPSPPPKQRADGCSGTQFPVHHLPCTRRRNP